MFVLLLCCWFLSGVVLYDSSIIQFTTFVHRLCQSFDTKASGSRMLTSILSEFASSIIDAMAMAMEFGVPKDCKDSPFHSKWRHFLLEYVKGPWFLHLPAEVKLAIKKFLDHPTSLPYDEQRIDNFMTNRFEITAVNF